MDSENKQVLVLGAGVAGLTAALEIARSHIPVRLIEKKPYLGGHAVHFTCKATTACVSCGACIIEDKLKAARSHPLIRITPNSRLAGVSGSPRLIADIENGPEYIAPEKCTRCGVCIQKCPYPGAIRPGYSSSDPPFITESCLFLKDQSCTLCQDICPSAAINLQRQGSLQKLISDAVVIATGFQAFNPKDKPYGYGRFSDVVTSLDLERMLKRQGVVKRPSDGTLPQRIAFIQCVGSRDVKLGHLWCSRVCCASGLRMAMLIKKRQPRTQISFFYIDIQTFGSNFQQYYRELPRHMDLIRAIPGDIMKTDDNRLRLLFFDNRSRQQLEDTFDLVVLSVGIIPGKDTDALSGLFLLNPAETGFFPLPDSPEDAADKGIFVAGSACGPMNIAESAAHATRAAWRTVRFLNGEKND
ncbi:MAG: FAD-dependent oxidoreductase [Desulfobacterales bacterium]|nr:FAD-dependent oxidoreductase [Desulfobacterales bacterium]